MNFSSLRVYQKAIQLEREIQIESNKAKAHGRRFAFDQILRSSKSIGANIAEGYGKKYTKGIL